MTDAIVIGVDRGLTCCLDSWPVSLIRHNTRYLSFLWDSTVFYPIITSQVIVSEYGTTYSQVHATMEVSLHHMCLVMCNYRSVHTSHVLSHGHMHWTKMWLSYGSVHDIECVSNKTQTYVNNIENKCVKGFTPLCLTWAALVDNGLVAASLWIPPEVWINKVRGWDRTSLEWTS